MKEYKNRLIFCITLIGCVFVISPWQMNLEEQTGLQWLFSLRGQTPAPEGVAIVALSNEASRRLGLSRPGVRWSRKIYAQLISEIAARGAKIIALDIAFKEARPSEDPELAKAIANAGNVILFNYIERQVREIGGPGKPGTIDIQQPINAPDQIRVGALGSANFALPANTNRVVKAQIYRDLGLGLEASMPVVALFFHNQERMLSLINYLIKNNSLPEGIYQQQRLVDILNTLKQLSVTKSDSLKSVYKEWIFNASNQSTAEIDSRRALIDAITHDGDFHINYYGASRTIPTIPVDELLNKTGGSLTGDNADLHGKVVFVGLSETIQTEQYDTYKTVFSNAHGLDISGVEILATVFANLHHRESIKPITTPINLISLVLLAFSTAICFTYFSFTTAVIVQLVIYSLYAMVAYQLFKQNLWLPLFSPFLLILLLNVSVLAAQYTYSRKKNKLAVEAMSHYLPAHIATRITDVVDKLESQRQVVRGVCLMTDLHGFSGISEKLSPEELHKKLNLYYDILVQTVTDHEGHVANIVGDSLLALWSAPEVDEVLCKKSISAARTMLEKLNKQDDLKSYFATTSIGLHAGEFSLGNLGAQDHFEYAPVGDTVNTTARIEKLNRTLGTRILLSETVVSTLNNTEYNKDSFRYLGRFALHNKTQTVKLYDYIDDEQRQSREYFDYLDLYSRAVALFESGNYIHAKQLFLKLQSHQNNPARNDSNTNNVGNVNSKNPYNIYINNNHESFYGPAKYYLTQCKENLDFDRHNDKNTTHANINPANKLGK